MLNAIELLIGQPLLSHNGPTTVFATVNAQQQENRWVVHLLHYIPERRSQEIDIIEDVIPLYDLEMAVRLPRAVKAVTCVPEMEPIEFKVQDGTLWFTLDKLHGHQMIEIAFA